MGNKLNTGKGENAEHMCTLSEFEQEMIKGIDNRNLIKKQHENYQHFLTFVMESYFLINISWILRLFWCETKYIILVFKLMGGAKIL